MDPVHVLLMHLLHLFHVLPVHLLHPIEILLVLSGHTGLGIRALLLHPLYVLSGRVIGCSSDHIRHTRSSGVVARRPRKRSKHLPVVLNTSFPVPLTQT